MVLSEVLETLRQEGLPAVAHRLHYAFTAGHIARPQRDGSGRYRFSDADVARCRQYLKNLPKPGRKKQPTPA